MDRWTHFKLPGALRAVHPDEVGTVALVTWGWRRVGTSVDQETNRETGEAHQGTAELTLVDLSRRAVIGRRSFEGDEPAGGLTREGDFRSERPIFKVLAYLEQLPRR